MGYEFPQLFPDCPSVFFLRCLPEFLKESRQFGGESVVPCNEDFLEPGGFRAFLGSEKFLEEFFPRADAREDDVDVCAGLEARKTDEVRCQVDDLDRLAHVEHEDGTVPLHAPRLEDELGRLGDGHEVPGHLRVGDGDGAAPADLFLEGGDDAAPAAQYVAEPDGDEGPSRKGFFRRRADDHFGHPLGGAHDGGGVHRLVGGDVDEDFHVVLQGEFRKILGAEDVVEDGFFGVLLHEGDVLVGRRVEDHLGGVGLEDTPQALPVAHVGHHGGDVADVMDVPEFLLDLEEAVLPPP